MRKNKKQRRIMFLLIILLCLTLGFALLSTTLKINGTASIKSNTWDIHWDESTIAVSQGSVTAEDPEVSGEGDDTVSFEVELELPGDFYEFEIDAVNEGSIDGALDVITTKVYDSSDLVHPLSDGDIPEYLLYTVTYADGTPTTGDILEANDSKTYKIRVEFDEDWDEPADEDGEYVIKVEIPYIQHKEETTSPIVLPAGRTKDNLQVGDEICINGDTTECFNFIKYDNNDIVMLAKYNLKVGYTYDEYDTKIGEYTSNDSGYGLQSSEAKGYITGDGDLEYKAVVPFSATNYWYDNGLKSDYGTEYPAYVYDPINYGGALGTQTYSVAYYVEQYKNKLINEYGATIKSAGLLTFDDVTDPSIGCDISDYSCPPDSFITNTSFWLGSAYNMDCEWAVGSRNIMFDGDYNYDNEIWFGVRPAIVISKSAIN